MEPVSRQPLPTLNPLAGRTSIIDTETTGVEAGRDRIISFGHVELVDGQIGNTVEWFFNPGDTPIHPDALKIHGITKEFLADKPPIKSFLPKILQLVAESIICGHNVKFDVDMLNAELDRHRFPRIDKYIHGVFDTMTESKRIWPGKSASLDALCARVGVSTSHRQQHGALADALLCAQALLALPPEQQSFLAVFEDAPEALSGPSASQPVQAGSMIVLAASPEEVADHEAYLVGMLSESGDTPIWLQAPREAAMSSPAPVDEPVPTPQDDIAFGEPMPMSF